MNLLNVYRGTTLVKSMLHTEANKVVVDLIKDIPYTDVITTSYSETNDDMCSLKVETKDITILYKGTSALVQDSYQLLVNSIPTG